MPKYAEEILAAVTELQQHPKAEQVFLEMKREHSSIAVGTVQSSSTGDNVDLATMDEDCGVLKAMCTRCRDYMNTTQKENEVQCRTCKKKEKREVSINYVNS